MALQFDLAGDQIDGARDYQEDAFLITHLTDANGNPSALVIVADGMGGHAAGNVASNMAVQAFNKHVSSHYPTSDPAQVLEECVTRANDSIKETVAETPALAGMGCTMVAAILEEGKLWWASVGDSHVYLIRNRELEKKNADHSYGGFLDRMEAAGTPVEPEAGLARNMLMSALTGDDINEIDVSATPLYLQGGDRILLCSDGMDSISTGKVIQYSEWSDSPKECSTALLKAVEEAKIPKQDNTTAVVVSITDEAVAAVPVAEVGEAAASPSPAAEPAAQSQPQYYQEEPKGKAGLFIGIAAVVLIAAGAAYFYMTQGGLSDTSTAGTSTAGTSVDEPASDETVAAAEATEPKKTTQATAKTTQAKAQAKAKKPLAKAAAKKAAPKKAAAAPSNKPGQVFQDKLNGGGKGPEMVWIAAGTFQMGSPGSSRHAEERPRHKVKVKKFAMSKYEITFAQYDLYAKEKGISLPKDLYMDRATHPVIFVRWDDAYNYTQWLSEKTGQSYRLPTEAEWEYAAGSGKRSPHWWGYQVEPNRAHCQLGCETRFDPKKPTQIGSFGPNPFGLHDTAANVAEWVNDCWHPNYKGAPANGKTWVGGDCALRVVRGGSFFSPEDSIRHTKRDKFKSDSHYDHIGIRIVREVE